MEFKYKLMFEDRSISIYAYNIEMVLAEKLETDVSRGTVKAFIFSLFNHQALDIFPEDKKSENGLLVLMTGTRILLLLKKK